jgi:hypothetical protein
MDAPVVSSDFRKSVSITLLADTVRNLSDRRFSRSSFECVGSPHQSASESGLFHQY